MRSKYSILVIILGIVMILAFTGFAVWQATSALPIFDGNGYMLRVVEEAAQTLAFRQGDNYSTTISGAVSFQTSDGDKVTVPKTSFAHFDDGSTMALSDGVLLDFNDLSDNFINNYYMPSGLVVTTGAQEYTAQTTAGNMSFGEHIWKLADNMYMLRASSLRIHFGQNEQYDAGEFVQISVSNDGVYYIQSAEGLWSTISPDCYIETARGVRVYPVSLLVDDGTYKLSMAKLAVDTDDAIVLTEDNIREQVVPEIHITSIDGDDGSDGRHGNAGGQGASGSDGTEGEGGKNGGDGKGGNEGTDGLGGKPGGHGGDGLNGDPAGGNSSNFAVIPSMSISEWIISPTKVEGTIQVKDPSGLLLNMQGDKRYPAKITITEVKTGRVIDTSFAMLDDWNNLYYNGLLQDTVAFNTAAEAPVKFVSDPTTELKPDTEYRLSVTAYYMTEEPKMIYNREFISRVFTTDSSGVTLVYDSATSSSLTFSASVMDGVDSDDVTVYLLTPEQNKNFTLSSTKYVASSRLSNGKVIFDKNLTSNTDYVARVVVGQGGNNAILSSQELAVKTLKKTPTFTDPPKANFNRGSGATEVWRPDVEDPDNGAVSYTYTAYFVDTDGQTKIEGKPQTVHPGSNEMVKFYLRNGVSYTFGVTLEFFDNEKTLEFDLGRSAPVMGVGALMPTVTLVEDEGGLQFNAFKGLLTIQCDTNSAIQLHGDNGEKYPVTLEFRADQVMRKTFDLEEGQDVLFGSVSWDNTSEQPDGYQGTLLLNDDAVTQDADRVTISLDLENLKQNTQYTITAYARLNVGDGNGPTKRAIGTVSFRTLSPSRVKCEWPISKDTASKKAINTNLQIKLMDPVQGENPTGAARGKIDYELAELLDGSLVLTLYSGQGTNKVYLKQVTFVGEKLEPFFAPGGQLITEDTFDYNISDEATYTVEVSAVTDRTHYMSLGYFNIFADMLEEDFTATAEAMPPELLTDPSKGITATPIRNDQATSHGIQKNASLPNDAVIGYLLESTYDNESRVAESITYYAYEFKTFMNLLRGEKSPLHPDNVDQAVASITLPFDKNTENTPSLAMLFDGTQSEAASLFGDHYVYQAGSVQGDDLGSGMSRGHRYIFLYTVEFTTSNGLQTYPDYMCDIAFRNEHGGITWNNTQLLSQKGYFLHSGVCEVPRIMPTFHSYVYSTTQGSYAQTSASGSVELHYAWRDPERMITNETKMTGDETLIKADGKLEAAGSLDWYKTTVNYTLTDETAINTMTVSAKLSAYATPYSEWLKNFGLTEDPSEHPITTIPLDWSYGKKYEDAAVTGVQINTKVNSEDNYIGFYLMNQHGEVDDNVIDLAQRTVAMEVTLQSKTDTAYTETHLIPLEFTDNEYYGILKFASMKDYRKFTSGFKVTKANLIFDTGNQGWNFMKPASETGRPAVALQEYGRDSNNVVGWKSYYASSRTDIPASGSYWFQTSEITPASLRGIFKTERDQDTKVYLALNDTYLIRNVTGRYLYPHELGVNASGNLLPTLLGESSLVPKELKVLEMDLLTKEGAITAVAPTIWKPETHPSMNTVTVDASQIANPDGDKVAVYMAVYDDQNNAYERQNPVSVTVLNADGSILQSNQQNIRVEMETLANGQTWTKSIRLGNLASQKTYWIAYHYIAEGSNTAKLMDDADTSLPAVYEFTTTTALGFKNITAEYKNGSYLSKSYVVNFSPSRLNDVRLTYSIYETSEAAAAGTATPLLSDADLTGGANPMMSRPAVTENMQLTLDLKPNGKSDEGRGKLDPGKTYYLRIATVQEGGGHTVIELPIPTPEPPEAMIYPNGVSGNSITFRNIISDAEYTLMGKDKTTGYQYLVRFEYAESSNDGDIWHKLTTSYDNTLYTENQLVYDFVLNDKAVEKDPAHSKIQPNTNYRMLVFAVPDWDHDGLVKLPVLKTGSTTTDFVLQDFTNETVFAADTNNGSQLGAIVNNAFWNGSTPRADADIPQEARELLIGQKEKKTTTPGGYTLNTAPSKAYIVRNGALRLRLMLKESDNLVTKDGSDERHVFNYITWYVKGSYIEDGMPVSRERSGVLTQPKELLKAGTDGFNDYFYLDIPEDFPTGSYEQIVIKFYPQAGDEANAVTITTSFNEV